MSPSFKSSQSACFLAERSPAHSWHAPMLRPRTHGCSREQALSIVEAPSKRPQSAAAPTRGQPSSETPSKRSERRWNTGELANHCKKIVAKPRQDRVWSLGRQRSQSRDKKENEEVGDQRVGIPVDPRLFDKPWTHFTTTAGRCTMEMDQPTLRHYVNYGRFQGDPFFYKGTRDSRFTHDVFNSRPELTNLSLLRRLPRNALRAKMHSNG